MKRYARINNSRDVDHNKKVMLLEDSPHYVPKWDKQMYKVRIVGSHNVQRNIEPQYLTWD